MNNVLIVTGMHRSGTSLVSHWLSCCQVLNLEETLLGADIGNVEGHFEDVDFYRYSRRYLTEAHHLSRFGMVAQPLISLSQYQKEKLKSIIDFKNKNEQAMGLERPENVFIRAFAL